MAMLIPSLVMKHPSLAQLCRQRETHLYFLNYTLFNHYSAILSVQDPSNVSIHLSAHLISFSIVSIANYHHLEQAI